MDGFYTAAALAMRYWFIAAAAIVLLGAVLISVKEYRDKRYVLGVAQSSIGYLRVVSGPEEIIDGNLALMIENTVGRSRKVDIVLPDMSVAKAHSQVYCSGGGVFVNRLGRGEVTVNGVVITDAAEIFDGDVICFGSVVTRLHLKEEN